MAYIQLTVNAGYDTYTYKYHSHRYGLKANKRGKNITPTTKEQKRINKRISERKRQWTASANFTKGDWWVTLTYRRQERPEENKAAHKILTKTLSQLRRKLKRQRTEFYYMGKTERGEKGAVHHHLLIKNNFDIGRLIELWKYGRVDIVSIYTGSMAILSDYINKDSNASAKHKNKLEQKLRETLHTASRNLKKPEIKKKVINASTFSEMPAHKKDYYIIHCYNGFQSEAGYMYQEYIQTRQAPDSETDAQTRFTVFTE